ncbi:MAG: FAD-dependent oxidoreductase, partial [Hyphomicrobiaceae bacterium]
MSRADVIVVGLGAVGSAATLHLARQGKRVVGFDSWSPPHANGSSHGETRITRLAIGEGEEYSPLAIRSHELWREFERETGVDLLVQCGGLIISNRVEAKESHGVPAFLDNTIGAARKFGIPHECLSAADIRRRFPQFNVADHEAAYYEPSAGYLHVEACVETQLKLA